MIVFLYFTLELFERRMRGIDGKGRKRPCDRKGKIG